MLADTLLVAATLDVTLGESDGDRLVLGDGVSEPLAEDVAEVDAVKDGD